MIEGNKFNNRLNVFHEKIRIINNYFNYLTDKHNLLI